METRASAKDREPELATPAEPRITTHKTGARDRRDQGKSPRDFSPRSRGPLPAEPAASTNAPAQPAGSRNASRLRQNKERGDTKFWRRFNASPWAARRHQRRIMGLTVSGREPPRPFCRASPL